MDFTFLPFPREPFKLFRRPMQLERQASISHLICGVYECVFTGHDGKEDLKMTAQRRLQVPPVRVVGV